MTFVGWSQIIILLALVITGAWALGGFMAAVFTGRRTLLTPMLMPIERGINRLAGVSLDEQNWKTYTLAMLAFNAAGFVVLYGLMRLQGVLPLNPQGFAAVPEALSFNTAMSFVTNTNWQAYAGESTMSHFVQMAGFTVHNFLSAATGIALAVAFTRAFARNSATTIGNFWDDLDLPDKMAKMLFVKSEAGHKHQSSYSRCVTVKSKKLKHSVLKNGKAVHLTPKEFDLLLVLIKSADRVLTHRHILLAVWGPAHSHDVQYLRVFIGQLRQKIERNTVDPALILTEPGIGYRISGETNS